ncbi:hypothetical protein [Pseudoxanthomonas sp. GW2]|uniref:hypothetical protein n=1 Tax=Pseudoxanthomonas sp. GW2 TaxID=1211114 RepID=UPI0012EA23A1|nr:hypothetical protein [Pseudoxanthomonas sp. GW2]
MDKETLSVVLSTFGLLLGLISAQAQLKSMAKWALKTGGNRARAWVKRMDDDAELYASSSSALVAFIAKGLFSIAFFLALVIALLLLLRGDTFTAPLWVRQVIMLASTIWIGNKLADISNLVDLTLRKARRDHGNDG